LRYAGRSAAAYWEYASRRPACAPWLTARYAVFLPSAKTIEAGRLSHNRQFDRIVEDPRAPRARVE
jgi:hypothetical protein